jgi:septin family protein
MIKKEKKTPVLNNNNNKNNSNDTKSTNSRKNSDSIIVRPLRSLKLKGYVGFDKICDQFVNRVVKEGFAFNILCIGETGIGKSTFINTLFNASFNLPTSSHHELEVKLNSKTIDLNEDNVNLKLTIVKTSGFGDQINKANSHDSIEKYLNEQFESYVQEELQLKRQFKQINDKRIHVCLYFISPTGHSLKALDIKTMKALDKKVNIIPIIGKADTVSKSELAEFKKKIMNDLVEHNIDVYQFPINDYDLDISEKNSKANGLYPFAIIGSTDLVKIGNKLTRGRHYEWGTVSVENESHCDFLKLKEMLISTNMLDLIELTHTRNYQIYRADRLKQMGFSEEDDEGADDFNGEESERVGDDQTKSNSSILNVFRSKQEELDRDINIKELEIKEDFFKRINDKENEVKRAEKEVNNYYFFVLNCIFNYFCVFVQVSRTIHASAGRTDGSPLRHRTGRERAQLSNKTIRNKKNNIGKDKTVNIKFKKRINL